MPEQRLVDSRLNRSCGTPEFLLADAKGDAEPFAEDSPKKFGEVKAAHCCTPSEPD
jgi:hypothetical protein